MHEPVQDRVCQGVVADRGVPRIERELADHGGRGVAVSVVHDFEQVVARDALERFEPPVVKDQQLGLIQQQPPNQTTPRNT